MTSSPLDWVVFTVDQGMAAMPWARRKAETMGNFIMKKDLKGLNSVDCGFDCDEDDESRESVGRHLVFIDFGRFTRHSRS